MNDYLNCDLTTAAIKPLLNRLISLYEDVSHQAELRLTNYAHYLPEDRQLPSAVNLAHYLALRSIDLRELQEQLAALGLSSLDRGEAGIVDNLNRVIALLCCILGEKTPDSLKHRCILSNEAGKQLLQQNTNTLLGEIHEQREVRIMVTLPSSAADDYELVKGLLETGMNCARINCAHDTNETWKCMVDNVHRAVQETGKHCHIMMDLAGQKIRTGEIEPGPAIYHLKVKRDEFGKVISPGYLKIVKQSRYQTTTNDNYLRIGIEDDIHADLETGDHLNLVDNRGKHRHLEVVERSEDDETILARCWQSTYLSDKSVFQLRRKGSRKTQQHHIDIRVSAFQPAPAKIRVFKNDHVLLTATGLQGRAILREKDGSVLQPAQIGISHSEILDQLKPGAAVWIDDGKIGTLIESVTAQGVLLRVTHARVKGTLIRSDKGVNFPDTELNLPALTDKDLQDLDFVCQHADIIGFSFVQSKEDMNSLMAELLKRNAAHLPVIAKIETAKAVKNLPEIILSALGRTTLGVMIARGDLAVELGSVRMAEIQEEILWLCEAAHVPVVWATQVLESLAKQGIHSRPEITDAAMSVRAECVMLNKGPYIMEAVTVLNDILVRMQEHQYKKSSRLRALQQWPLSEPLVKNSSLDAASEDECEQLAS